MEVSVGIYAIFSIFIFLVIPGFVARRSYYNGEFSKQFNWTVNTLNNFLSCLFIGVFLCLAFIGVINIFAGSKIDLASVLNVFHKYFVSNSSFTEEDFKKATTSIYEEHIPFTLVLYLFSAAVGFMANKVILLTALDTKFKIFRFQNTWHYLFSGKLLKLKKHVADVKRQKLKYTYLDVLVEAPDGTRLYSGLYADYDLSMEQVNKLEKLHLLRAIRYSKNEEGKVVPKPIPGEVLTIVGEKILNINCTYIYITEDERKTQLYNRFGTLIQVGDALIVWIFLFVLIALLFSFNPFAWNWLAKIYSLSFWYKLILIFAINLLAGMILPFKVDKANKKIHLKKKEFVLQLVVFIVLVALLYYFY